MALLSLPQTVLMQCSVGPVDVRKLAVLNNPMPSHMLLNKLLTSNNFTSAAQQSEKTPSRKAWPALTVSP